MVTTQAISFAPYGFHYYPTLVEVVCGDKKGVNSLAGNLLLYRQHVCRSCQSSNSRTKVVFL